MNEAMSVGMFMRMAVIIWAIWSAKRKVVYEDIHQSPLSTHLFIQSYFADFHTLRKPLVGGGSTSAQRATHWIAPRANMMKINVDTAVAGRSGWEQLEPLPEMVGESF